ncbi:MAG: HAMP domain-containing protein, partial [Methanoregula sp.]|nr:HAMP domain-containing protein [Methanoregula sp.]
MKIRTQLIVGMVIFGLLLVVLSGLVIATNQQVDRLVSQENIANSIALDVGELSYLTNDYILYHEPQQAERWNAKYSSLSDHVASLSVDQPEQRAIVDNMKVNLRNIKSVFYDISSHPQQPGSAGTGFVQLSWSKMAVQDQAMVFDAGRLARSLSEQASGLQQVRLLLIFTLMGAYIAMLLTAYFFLYRRTLKSITGLQEGARIIGTGNLDFTIEENGEDEIGAVSHAFNQMTANLKQVTASKKELEKEVAERKRAEVALKKSEEKFQSLYMNMIDGAALHELTYNDQGVPVDYVIIETNPAFEIQLGIPRGSVIGKTSREAYSLAEPPYLEIYTQVALTGEPKVFETYFPPLAKHFSISAFCPHKGRFATVFEDITERKRAEEALRQVNKQLNLLSSITRHDILNQLMALKGYLELSRDYLDDKKTLGDFLEKEEKAARTIERQITFTRDYQELGVAAPAWQNVNASIKKAVTGLPMRAVRVEVDPKDPAIFADPLFEKVFYNLIDNALRYGGAEMKTIRVLSRESDASLTILCEDDGVGISAEDKKKLFTRGFGKHTGLGLFLSR